MQIKDQQIKKFLLDFDLVTESQFLEVLEKAKKNNQRIEDILISEGIIKKEELIKIKAHILSIPFINLEKEIISPKVLKIIPESIARSHNIVAFKKKEKNLEVAMLDPEDLQAIEFIKKKTNLKILPRLTTLESIKNILKQYQGTLEAEFGDIIKTEIGEDEIKSIKEDNNKGEEKVKLEKTAQELPVIRIVDILIKHAILEGSSDIHIEPSEKEVSVRYRVDGILKNAMTLPRQAALGVVARIKVLSNLKLDEHRLPQDGRFKIENKDFKYSVRVSILPVFNGEKIVMRMLSEDAKVFTLEEIGLRGLALERAQDNLKKPIGMILVVGPTGSGKTTTLYSMMGILNVPEVNISTVEDPVEYRMPKVNQVQVKSQIGLTFAAGLRSLLRQDPDVIMVGEIRDNETASLAVNAALTGHMVLSTLHTTSAAGTISRLIDMGIEPFLISSTLNIALAQRLARRLCKEKEKYFLEDSDIDNIAKYCNLDRILKILKEEKILKPEQSLKEIPFYRPKENKESRGGYKGRLGIYEVLSISETIKELIVEKVTSDEIQAQAQKEGMRTMFEDGFIKAAQGITSIEEILRVITE